MVLGTSRAGAARAFAFASAVVANCAWNLLPVELVFRNPGGVQEKN